MLLRRVTEDVKAQNWTAILIDFFIVIAGVYIGIQVSNWNDARKTFELERTYLVRLADDLRDNIAHFRSERKFCVETNELIKKFARVVQDPSSSDDVLIEAANDYFEIGWWTSSFSPKMATFDDLFATGNIDIIRNPELREALVELHANYVISSQTFRDNIDWALTSDSHVVYEFDSMRFDPRTSNLYEDRTSAETAQKIRDFSDDFVRHAASNYWLNDRALDQYDASIRRSEVVLRMIRSEL